MLRAWGAATLVALLATGCGSNGDGQAAPGQAIPAGRLVLVSEDEPLGEGGDSLLLVEADGGGRTVLRRGAFFADDATFSPDGRWLAYSVLTPAVEVPEGSGAFQEGADLFIANADGTGERRLTGVAGAYSWTPAFSPDSRSVAFATDRDGNWEIYAIDVGGGNLRRLTTRPEAIDFLPAWGPDGRIAFASDLAPDDPNTTRTELFVMEGDGTGLHQVTRNALSDEAPRFSPDGSRLAVLRDLDPTEEEVRFALILMNPDGGGEVNASAPFDSFEGFAEGFAFLPDGRLVLAAGLDGNVDLFVVEPDGSRPRRLTTDPSEEWGPVVSPDGRSAAFTRPSPSGFQSDVFVVPLEGGGERRLTDEAGVAYAVAWGGR
jgi:Tol biopolymer transport system component